MEASKVWAGGTVTRISRLASALCGAALMLSACGRKEVPAPDFSARGVQGVRFDPSYYYNLRQPVDEFVDSAVGAWQGRGINTVFFKAYDPEYGAVYPTEHAANAETDYAKKDLLRLFIDACHKRGVRLVAWLPVFEHKGAWEAHPEWRVKAEDGADFQLHAQHHPLCVRQEGFRTWWKGFLAELLAEYPDIDGVDFAEPAIVWRNTQTCFCGTCRKAIHPDGADPFSPAAVGNRAAGLTEILLASSAQVKAAGRTACVTFIATADPSTELLPFGRQKDLTGIDIDGLLAGPDRPQWLSVELMWQQWADTYDNPASFRPDWTRGAVERTLEWIGDRAHVLAHVEITPLGPVDVSPAEFVESIRAARRGGAQSIEFYDTHLADSLEAWPTLETAWREASERKALVLHDPGGLGAARQVATLFGHFGLATETAVVDSFAEERLGPNDLLAYVGTQEKHPLPAAFLSVAADPATRIFWANFNLDQLELADPATRSRLGFGFAGTRKSPEWAYVQYKGEELFKSDSTLNVVTITDSAKAQVLAIAKSTRGPAQPYLVRSGNFWFVADCPVDYIEEGGRDLAFADALHDFVGEAHPENRTALVRIEDVCPLTDARQLTEIADLLHAEGVPFTIALVPFYVDPNENTSVSLSDRPDFVKALRHAISRGAAIALHGSTHQYRGRSTHDFEFWDALHDAPLVEDSREYVRLRIQRGMDEMRKNGIYPIVFETPHYAASQLDYSVVDRHFSAEYGRRQVIDRTGFDQLVPYFIARHPSGTSIIPENLGYVPNDRQVAEPLLRFAKNNLVVRDGFASFFFHPWIDRKALSDLVKGIKGMGYRFADIRSIALEARADGIVHVTGSREAVLDPGGRHLRTFFLDPEGDRHDEWISDAPVTREFRRAVQCPPGWSFVAEALDEKPGILSSLPLPGPGFAARVKEGLLTPSPLKLSRGEPARPLILEATLGAEAARFGEDSTASPGKRDLFPPSQEAWQRAFAACGIDADSVPVERLLELPADVNLVVVPDQAGRLLSNQQAVMLAKWTERGGRLILEGPSALAERLGLRAEDSGWTTSEIRDDYLPGVPIRWAGPSPYLRFDADGDWVNQYSTPDDRPLVASGKHGDGRWIFFAAPFASAPAAGSTGSGPYRFPFLLELVQRELDLQPALKAPSLEVYFDPGAREEVPIEELVANWRRNGVRAVYLAGWHEYAKYTFEYAYAVALVHQAGMLAYAWLDLPHVSDRFWHEHPAWREKTAAGADAEMDDEIGWKQSMNLTNDTARAGAFNAVKRLLMMAPWDGAVLTGRLFTGDDPDSAQRITPFHPSFRAQYAKARGYDPAAIFDPRSPRSVRKSRKHWEEFLVYRDSVEQALTVEALDFLKAQRTLMKPGAEIILTRDFAGASPSADSLYRRLMASDSRVRLQAPAARRAVDAEALEGDVVAWRAAYPDWQPMVELNFERQKPRSGATPQLAGMELMEVVAAAERLGARLSLRTEAYLYDTDFRNLAYAAAASARERFTDGAWEIRTRGRTAAELDHGAVKQVLVDGRGWPAYDRGRLLLPAGDHRVEGAPRLVSWKTLLQAPARVTGFNGSIADARTTLQGLKLKYESAHPVALALNMPAVELTLDGLPYGAWAAREARPGKSSGGPGAPKASLLSLPAGTHMVEIATRPLSSSVMRQASVGLSVAIILISSLTVLAFGLLYVGGWLRRLYAGDGGEPVPQESVPAPRPRPGKHPLNPPR